MKTNTINKNTGFNSKIKSTLFKLVNNILPTNERLYQCRLRTDNKCEMCSRVDDQGHVLLCDNSPLKPITKLVIETIREVQQGISMDKIIQMDIEADKESIYTIGVIMATLYDHVIKCKKSGKKVSCRKPKNRIKLHQ